jgi:hypothetical protein
MKDELFDELLESVRQGCSGLRRSTLGQCWTRYGRRVEGLAIHAFARNCGPQPSDRPERLEERGQVTRPAMLVRSRPGRLRDQEAARGADHVF